MAVGMTFVIITGGIDLSVGATYALASVCGALVLAQFGASGGSGAVLVGILVTIGVGILGGFLNGSMIVAFNVHPFIITLGTMAIYRGIAFVQTNGQSIGGFPEAFRSFVRQEFNGLSLVPLIVMIIVMIIGGIFLAKMAIGRKVYAIGGNETASRYSGIRVGFVKILVYTISGSNGWNRRCFIFRLLWRRFLRRRSRLRIECDRCGGGRRCEPRWRQRHGPRRLVRCRHPANDLERFGHSQHPAKLQPDRDRSGRDCRGVV